eukprot:5213305-Amphidinium_carterae.1
MSWRFCCHAYIHCCAVINGSNLERRGREVGALPEYVAVSEAAVWGGVVDIAGIEWDCQRWAKTSSSDHPRS